jgi:hypothetical protein
VIINEITANTARGFFNAEDAEGAEDAEETQKARRSRKREPILTGSDFPRDLSSASSLQK